MRAINIVRADRDDLSALAEINRLAYADELTTKFALNEKADEKSMFEFFKARLASRFDHATSELFKATDPDTHEVVGFACWTLEKGGDEAGGPTPTGGILQQMPPYMNAEFVMATGAEIEQLREHMKKEAHYYLSAFAVKPGRQGEGIGSQLLEHCLGMADQAKLPSWLISFPRAHDLYLRHGFADVAYKDIDLNKWDRYRFRGYGIYRSCAMARQPQ
ncbi:hypothetical protein JX265_006965 [Neoarthrinium moseri]|uniref:N-acetyltransferase domain-containing protein n=2 Tax=Neoarthrinium moseri TaxID=1658444 RepID=A0A9P9WLJ4_9PEZI|nr:hypothetical protein JX265_006965 [Neoarthrinium moseri]